MDIRARMLEAAETQLAASPQNDISTREVCEAVGVGSPVLYRLFGDKNGLLTAVINHAFERYLSEKRAEPPSDDPVDDLYTAWDNHVAFAMENPTVYRLVYAPQLTEVPGAAKETRQLLYDRLIRCAEAGKLKTSPDEAAQAIMAACVGVALNVLSQPEIYSDPGLSARVRDAILREVTVPAEPKSTHRGTRPAKPVALQLAALIRRGDTPLTTPETNLMLQWLDTIAAADNPHGG
ncbi:TetR/AcrR family transcriptional regulator [Mycobacterium sp. 050134]|uniref:TetR/AcrR family transcriptional regulator n=1 Tax=Mycobacterium sp. 050134 TaxID=3096111 RepID=UPI002EDB07FA